MVLKVVKVSELMLGDGLGKCIPIFTEDDIIKVGYDNLKISVINQNNISRTSSVFTGHQEEISSIGLSQDAKILCSCSEDKVIVWDLRPLKNTTVYASNGGVIIGENIGYCTHSGFSCSNKWLSLCILREIWIVCLSQNLFTPGNQDAFKTHNFLKTDSSQIHSCSFSSIVEELLVSVEDFNHFKVWNVQNSSLVYRSKTMVNSYISFFNFSGHSNKLLIGSSTGYINIYNFNKKLIPNEFKTFTISKKDYIADGENNPDKLEEQSVGCTIYAASLFSEEGFSTDKGTVSTNSKVVSTNQVLCSIKSLGSILISASNQGIMLHSLKSSECLGFILFSDQRISDSLQSSVFDSNLLENIILTGNSIQNIKCFIKVASSKQKIYSIGFSYEKTKNQVLEISSMKCPLHVSFLSSTPLKNQSPLSYNMNMNGKHSCPNPASNPMLSNLVKVKSSGYGKGPRPKMFSPSTNVMKSSKTHFKANKNNGVLHKNHTNHEKNALDCGPPIHMEKNITICKTSGISGRLAYSEDGEFIACSSISSQVGVLPSEKLELKRSVNLAGHDSDINSLSFNLNSEWLISGSSDATVRVWDWRNRNCILKIDEKRKPISVERKEFSKNPVRQASFFYLDKFIFIARNSEIDLYSHLLHHRKPGSNWHADGKIFQKVKRIPFPTQQVTCFTAANQFHSYLVMTGCSNRDIMVYDLNHQKFQCTFKEAHSHRPPHRLVQFTGSICPRIPAYSSDTYNLFLSTAIKDGAKLWDLRTPKCIQKYDMHLNRIYTSGIDISPCCRYVAVCSEDKQVYLYDTRNCENYLKTIGGFPEAVMDVAFSPCMTQLAALSLNGHLLTFKSKP